MTSSGLRAVDDLARAWSITLRTFVFTGDVHAMPEGTVFFANEPILRVTAPLPEAQLVESRLLNILHFQMLIAAEGGSHGARRAPPSWWSISACAGHTAPRPD